MQLPDIKLDRIPDEATRALVEQLLNLIETLAADTAVLRLEVQRLRDENARLKGGSGKPDIKPPLSPPPHVERPFLTNRALHLHAAWQEDQKLWLNCYP